METKHKTLADLIKLAQKAIEFIDALPKDLVLPSMPGFNRDWADDVIHEAAELYASEEYRKLNGFNNGRDTTDGIGGKKPIGLEETKTTEELFEDASKKGLKIVFGLEAQGHIPTIQAELRRWNDSYIEQFPDEEPLDMSYSKHVWERIGKIIGWCPFTASLHYFQWLKLNELTRQQEINADLQKRLSESESAIEGSDIKIYDLKKQNAELVKEISQLDAIWSDRFPDCICNKHEKRYCPSHSDGPDC